VIETVNIISGFLLFFLNVDQWFPSYKICAPKNDGGSIVARTLVSSVKVDCSSPTWGLGWMLAHFPPSWKWMSDGKTLAIKAGKKRIGHCTSHVNGEFSSLTGTSLCMKV